MALILQFERKVELPQGMWHIEELLNAGSLVGYKVVRFDVELQEIEILDTFPIDTYNNGQTEAGKAWVKAATLVNRANRDVLGLD